MTGAQAGRDRLEQRLDLVGFHAKDEHVAILDELRVVGVARHLDALMGFARAFLGPRGGLEGEVVPGPLETLDERFTHLAQTDDSDFH